MPNKPLLIFPSPTRAAKAKRSGRGGKLRIPEAQHQFGRLKPQFQRLQRVMNQQRVALQGNALGLLPEKVLVLETVGPIENFINAVKKIAGLEWLGEFETEDIEPAYGFEDAKAPTKRLSGQLFLVMTDQQALRDLQGLFNNWRRNPTLRFPQGLAPWKNAFVHLLTIRPWEAQDRTRDTGLFEDWKVRLEHGEQIVPFEAELWFRESSERRRQSEALLRSLVGSTGGEVIQQCVIPEIAYHGLLGRIPTRQVEAILNQQEVRLLQCEDVMYLRPIGQCAIHLLEQIDGAGVVEDRPEDSLSDGNPIVALLDGLPLAGHRLLNGRLILDDPDDYERNYQARERLHGTAMASLICRGDLEETQVPLSRPVYVRPILQPHRGFDGRFFERIPEGVLPVDLIHRAVLRLFDGEAGQPPMAPNVRVINLSICDPSRPFVRGMSSWARLLDWLSWKYNVLFVVSAGNHERDIELDLPRTEFHNLSPSEIERAVIKALATDTRNRRLLSPAESLNSITLGAIHADRSTPALNPNHVNPYTRQNIPSPVSSHGPGYRRSVKPDIFFPGGRQFLVEKMGNTHTNATLQLINFVRPPGHCVASPGQSGELDRMRYTRGTSNAAALASRGAALIYDVINDLRIQHTANLPKEYDTVLLKTLLVHGADWVEAIKLYESILSNEQNHRTFRDYVGRFLGYGMVDLLRVVACTDQRVTVLGLGSLEDGEADEFQFPLPPTLSARVDKRRLTITLAWLSPTNTSRQNYRIAHLWFDPKNDLVPTRTCADHRAVTRGTVQHEVLEGDRAVDFQDGDSITIKVNCRADAGDILSPVRYGLAVTLEVAAEISIPIYQEVRDRLRIRIPVTGSGV